MPQLPRRGGNGEYPCNELANIRAERSSPSDREILDMTVRGRARGANWPSMSPPIPPNPRAVEPPLWSRRSTNPADEQFPRLDFTDPQDAGLHPRVLGQSSADRGLVGCVEDEHRAMTGGVVQRTPEDDDSLGFEGVDEPRVLVPPRLASHRRPRVPVRTLFLDHNEDGHRNAEGHSPENGSGQNPPSPTRRPEDVPRRGRRPGRRGPAWVGPGRRKYYRRDSCTRRRML